MMHDYEESIIIINFYEIFTLLKFLKQFTEIFRQDSSFIIRRYCGNYLRVATS